MGVYKPTKSYVTVSVSYRVILADDGVPRSWICLSATKRATLFC